MPVIGICHIQPHVESIEYVVNGEFNYHVMTSPGTTVTFSSAVPNQPVTIQGNIWGGGNVTINCDVTMSGGMGAPPGLQGLPVYTYGARAPDGSIVPPPAGERLRIVERI